MGAAVSASMIVYVIACAKLEQGAERHLTGDTVLLAELVQRRFDAELRKFEHWATMPMVIRTALNYTWRSIHFSMPILASTPL